VKDPGELAAAFLAEMRSRDFDAEKPATDLLQWEAEDTDDEVIWDATLLIVEGASDDGERWMIGDGLIDESIATRSELRARWHAARKTNPHVDAMFRVMHRYLGEEGHDLGWWDLNDQVGR